MTKKEKFEIVKDLIELCSKEDCRKFMDENEEGLLKVLASKQNDDPVKAMFRKQYDKINEKARRVRELKMRNKA